MSGKSVPIQRNRGFARWNGPALLGAIFVLCLPGCRVGGSVPPDLPVSEVPDFCPTGMEAINAIRAALGEPSLPTLDAPDDVRAELGDLSFRWGRATRPVNPRIRDWLVLVTDADGLKEGDTVLYQFEVGVQLAGDGSGIRDGSRKFMIVRRATE